MAQREFYFQKRIFSEWREIYIATEILLICCNLLCGRKDYFLEKIICSKDYRLKEQTWLAIYERGYPRKFIKEVTPVKRKSNPPFYRDFQLYF